MTGTAQECMSRQEVQSTLRHVHKLLSAHETSFLQSVRSLRKKLNLLHNTTVKHSSNISTGKDSTREYRSRCIAVYSHTILQKTAYRLHRENSSSGILWRLNSPSFFLPGIPSERKTH